MTQANCRWVRNLPLSLGMAVVLAIPVSMAQAQGPANPAALQEQFVQAARAGNTAQAIQIGETLVSLLEQQARVNPAFLADDRLWQTHVHLGNLYGQQDLFDKAISHFRRAEELVRRASGPKHPNLGVVLTGLAQNYFRGGEYLQAARTYEQANAITAASLGQKHPDLAHSLTGLGMVYESLGDMARAEQHLHRALEIRQASLPPDDPYLANTMEMLGSFFSRKGDYERAEKFLSEAASIYQKRLGVRNDRTAAALESLGIVCKYRGDLEAAASTLLAAHQIRVALHGEGHPLTASTVSNLGGLFAEVGDYKRARELNEHSLAIVERAYGPRHRVAATIHNNLGYACAYLGDSKTAREHIDKALVLYKAETRGDASTAYANCQANLALLHAMEGRFDQSRDCLAQANAIYEASVRETLAVGLEDEKLAYMQKIAGKTHFTVWLGVVAAPQDPLAGLLALETVLRRKGRVEDAMGAAASRIRQALPVADQEKLARLHKVRASMARMTFAGDDSGGDELARLRAEAEMLERALGQAAGDRFRTEPEITLAAVQRNIPPEAVLIEYVRFRPFDAKVPKFEEDRVPQRYAACLVARDGPILWKDLGQAAAIDKAIALFRVAVMSGNAGATTQLGKTLHEKLLAPFEAQLKDRKHWLISPDGLLNVLPFAALCDGRGNLLLDTCTITYLTSGRDLLRLASPVQGKGDMTVIANPDYAAKPAGQDEGPLGRRARGFRPITFQPLPGTAAEGEAIRQLLPAVKLFSGQQATEGQVKSLNSPCILHIATHGFFLPDQRLDVAYVMTSDGPKVLFVRPAKPENPLVRCGLVLAGANHLRSGGEDGILTGLEFCGLNLSGTQMVVLSACETGLGDVLAGEGVFGLRRSLVIAGGQTQVISLWAVHDVATKELMRRFYVNLRGGMPRGEALRQAQRQLIDTTEYKQPVFWAAFTLSGDWRPLAWPGATTTAPGGGSGR